MKKILTLFISLATIFSFASCQKEISAPKGQHTVRFTCELSEQTKTALIGTTVKWTELDKTLFHVFENGVEATAENLVVELEDGIATVTAIFDDTDATEFKYDAFVASLNTSKKPTVLKEQNATSTSYDPAADVLIAQPIVTTDQNESLELKFCFSREVSINKMTLKGIHEGETIKKVTFTGEKSIAGSFDPAKDYAYSAVDKTISINTNSDVVYFVCSPCTVTPTVVVTTDKAAYTKTFAKSITFNKNELHSFSVSFTDENRAVADNEYTLVSNISQLSAGDVIVLGCAAKSSAAGAMGTGAFFTSVDATINDGVLVSAAAIEITLGKSGDYWILTTSEGIVGASKAKELKLDAGTQTWEISVSEECAVITNSNSSYGSILYNAASPRFLNYTSGQTAIEIYRKGGVSTDVVNVSSVTINQTSATLEVGETVTLVATVNPDNATNKSVTWSSNDEDVATVENGVVTAVAEGTATITVTTVDGSKTAACAVTVNAAQVIETTIADALTKVGDGKTYQVTGTASSITNTTYGNFTLVDGDASILIYGLLTSDGEAKKFADLDIAAGDQVTLKGQVIDYNGTIEIKNAVFVSRVKATVPDTPTTPVYASLAELVAAGAPTTTAKKVTVTLNDEEIKSIYVTSQGYRNGIFVDAGEHEIEIFSRNVPESWVAGGTVSGTLTECDWKLYNTTWELCPTDWTELTYTAPTSTGGDEGGETGGDEGDDTSSWATVESSNVDLVLGTNGSDATVNGEAAIKVGTSKLGGDCSVKVRAGATKLYFHAAAWNGVSGLSLNITPADKVSKTSVALKADAGIANNTPFTLSGKPEDYFFELDLSGITAETTITFTTSSAKRFVLWGVNAE